MHVDNRNSPWSSSESPPAELRWTRGPYRLARRRDGLRFVPDGRLQAYGVPFWRGIPRPDDLRKRGLSSLSSPWPKKVGPEFIDDTLPAIALSNVWRARGQLYATLPDARAHWRGCPARGKCPRCRGIRDRALAFVQWWGVLDDHGDTGHDEPGAESLEDFLTLAYVYAERLDWLYQAFTDLATLGVCGYRALMGRSFTPLARGLMQLAQALPGDDLPDVRLGATIVPATGPMWGFLAAHATAQHPDVIRETLRRLRQGRDARAATDFERWLTAYLDRAVRDDAVTVPPDYVAEVRAFFHELMTAVPDPLLNDVLIRVRVGAADTVGWNHVLAEMHLQVVPVGRRLIPTWSCPTLWHAAFLQMFLWLEAGTGTLTRCGWDRCQRLFVRRLGPEAAGQPRKWCREACRKGAHAS